MHEQEEKESTKESDDRSESSEKMYQLSQEDHTIDSEQKESDSSHVKTEEQPEPVKVKDLFDSAPSYQNGEDRMLPQRSLADKTLYAWRFGAVIEAIFFFIFSAAYWGASQFIALPMWGLYTLIAITLVWAVFYISIWQSLCWSRWKYQVYDDEVELMFGVVIKRRIIIPMIRVQHVDTRQGPVLRYLGLASVTISTAATVHEVPGLTLDNAARLRDQIAELAREADPDE